VQTQSECRDDGIKVMTGEEYIRKGLAIGKDGGLCL